MQMLVDQFQQQRSQTESALLLERERTALSERQSQDLSRALREREEVIRFNLPRVRELGMFDEVYLRTEIEHVRALGYAARNTGLLEGMSGVAVPICDAEGRAVAALSVGTIAGRLSADRLPVVVDLLQREALAIGPRLNPFDPTLRRPVQSLAALLPNQTGPGTALGQ